MDSVTWQISKATEHDLARVVFAEELTLDVIRARVSQADNRDGTAGYRMNPLSVLYGDVVVEVSASGLTPEEVWEMFRDLTR
jgi:hypothetical protein